MRIRLLPRLLLITGISSLLISCSTAKRETPTRLTVMTYNIRIGKGGGEWNNDPTKVDLDPVIKLINYYSPDLVGLQEVDRFRQRTSLMNQPAMISERLGMHIAFQPAYSVSASSGTNEDYGNALLSRFPIASSQRVALFKPEYRQSHPQYPDYYSEQRGLLHAEVKLSGRPVHLFVTHLGLTADQREKQIAQIAEVAARYRGPKIIMGDLNADPAEPALRLLSNDYQDVLTATGADPIARRSYPAGASPREAIDYIFVSKEFRVLAAKVIRDQTLASDHNPVVAEIELLPGRP